MAIHCTTLFLAFLSVPFSIVDSLSTAISLQDNSLDNSNNNDCPLRNGGYTDLYYRTEVGIKVETRATCSEDDQKQVGIFLNFQIDNFIDQMRETAASHNQICSTPELYARHDRKMLEASKSQRTLFEWGDFIYNGGGWCRWCDPDDSGDRRFLRGANVDDYNDSFMGEESPDDFAVDDEESGMDRSLMSLLSSEGIQSKSQPEPTPAPHSSSIRIKLLPTESPVSSYPELLSKTLPPIHEDGHAFAAFMMEAEGKLKIVLQDGLEKRFSQDSGHCFYGSKPLVAVNFAQQSNSFNGFLSVTCAA